MHPDPDTIRHDAAIRIVGSGFTGATLAAKLQRAGFSDVVILEAFEADVTQGGGVLFLDHATLGTLESLGISPEQELSDYPFEEVGQIYVQDRRVVRQNTILFPRQSARWFRIHTALHTRLAPGTVRVPKRVISMHEDDGRAVLGFKDGSREVADVLVWADGRNSLGRRLLQPERPITYAGWTVHRGETGLMPPDCEQFLRVMPQDGQRRGKGLVNFYPVLRAGSPGTYWEVDQRHTSDQYAEMFGATPEKRAFMLPRNVSPHARRTVDDVVEELLPGSFVPVIADTSDRMAAPMFTIDPPQRMVHMVGRTPVVLAGDALAPVFPMTGRGANGGIAEAASLANALTQVARFRTSLPTALEDWQTPHLRDVAAALAYGRSRAHALGLSDTAA